MILPFDKTAFSYSTLEAEPFVLAANHAIESLYQKREKVSDEFFYLLAVRLSELNIHQKNGGPFGAVLVAFDGGIKDGQGLGKPHVIGVGANHVMPYHDPSAHAEMVTLQNAAQLQGYSDLSQTILYSSCECCPMCLSTAIASGVSKICYINTRHQAAAIDFSDKLQYELFKLPTDQQMTALEKLDSFQQKDYLEKLGTYDAVILDDNGCIYAQGQGDTTIDPTNIASINAIRASVKKYAEVQESYGNRHPVCWLPQKFTLICRKIPHPAGLIAADWARLLRNRNPAYLSNPAYDHVLPDPSRLIHVTHDYEELFVSDDRHHIHQYVDAESLSQYLSFTAIESDVSLFIERCIDHQVRRKAEAVFKIWKDKVDQGAKLRY